MLSGLQAEMSQACEALCPVSEGYGILSVLSGLLKWASQPHCHASIHYAFGKLSIIQEVNQYFLGKPRELMKLFAVWADLSLPSS